MGLLDTGLKLFYDHSEKKKQAKEQREKKLIVKASQFPFVVWISDEKDTAFRSTAIRVSLINPKNYEVRIQTIKLLSETFSELEVKILESPETIFPGPQNTLNFNWDFSALRLVKNGDKVRVRLIDHEGQFHDSAFIRITSH